MPQDNTKSMTNRFILFLEQKVSLLTDSYKRKIFLRMLWLLLFGLGVLAAYMIFISPQYIYVHISEEIQEKQNGFLDSFMKAVSWFGSFSLVWHRHFNTQ